MSWPREGENMDLLSSFIYYVHLFMQSISIAY